MPIKKSITVCVVVVACGMFSGQVSAGLKAKVVKGAVEVTSLFNKDLLHGIPQEKLADLARMLADGKTSKLARKEIGRLKLNEKERADVFSQIAVLQGKITPDERRSYLKTLRGTAGLDKIFSKISGTNDSVAKGHLFELKTAYQYKKKGTKVVEIGKKFDDGIKNNFTDADILVKYKEKYAIIETKNYAHNSLPPFDMVRADMVSMTRFVKAEGRGDSYIKVFSLNYKPDEKKLLMLEKIAKQNGVKLCFGDAVKQSACLKQLFY